MKLATGGLESLVSLHTLDISHNQLISSKGLEHVASVQTLNLSHNHLSSLDDLLSLGLLTTVDVSSNNLLQVSFFIKYYSKVCFGLISTIWQFQLPKLENQVLLRELLADDNSLSSVDELSTAWLPLLHRLSLTHNG